MAISFTLDSNIISETDISVEELPVWTHSTDFSSLRRPKTFWPKRLCKY